LAHGIAIIGLWRRAISWRLTGSLDTLILSYIITRNFAFAGSIATVETVTKVVLYYAHERTWTAIPWGNKSPERPAGIERHPDRRSWVAKSVATAVDLTLYLRHLVHPAKLGTIGAFLICFVIVISPQSFFRTHVGTEPSAPLNALTANLATSRRKIEVLGIVGKGLTQSKSRRVTGETSGCGLRRGLI
jgi:uncharacterized membrane protein